MTTDSSLTTHDHSTDLLRNFIKENFHQDLDNDY